MEVNLQATPPLRLTFGVEVECAIILKPRDYKGWKYSCLDDVRRCIEGVDAPVHGTNVFIGGQGSYYKWGVSQDVTISEHTNISDEDVVALELVTRIFDHGDPSSAAEITRVLQAVNDRFKIRNDHTTRFHVHVGQGREGFTLNALKRVACLLVGMEHLLNALVPDRRVRNDVFKLYCRPPSTLLPFRGKSVFERIELVEGVANMDELGHVMNPKGCRCVAYNFNNMWKPQQHVEIEHIPKTTLEFRQFAGTTDPEEILANVDLCTGLVAFGATCTQAELFELLGKAMDQNFGPLDLLASIDRLSLVPYFSKRLHLENMTLRRFAPPWAWDEWILSAEAKETLDDPDEMWDDSEGSCSLRFTGSVDEEQTHVPWNPDNVENQLHPGGKRPQSGSFRYDSIEFEPESCSNQFWEGHRVNDWRTRSRRGSFDTPGTRPRASGLAPDPGFDPDICWDLETGAGMEWIHEVSRRDLATDVQAQDEANLENNPGLADASEMAKNTERASSPMTVVPKTIDEPDDSECLKAGTHGQTGSE